MSPIVCTRLSELHYMYNLKRSSEVAFISEEQYSAKSKANLEQLPTKKMTPEQVNFARNAVVISLRGKANSIYY